MNRFFFILLLQCFFIANFNLQYIFPLATQSLFFEDQLPTDLGGVIGEFLSINNFNEIKLTNRSFKEIIADEKHKNLIRLLYRIIPELKIYMNEKGKGHSVLNFRGISQNNSVLDLLMQRFCYVKESDHALFFDLAISLLQGDVAIMQENAKILLGLLKLKYSQIFPEIISALKKGVILFDHLSDSRNRPRITVDEYENIYIEEFSPDGMREECHFWQKVISIKIKDKIITNIVDEVTGSTLLRLLIMQKHVCNNKLLLIKKLIENHADVSKDLLDELKQETDMKIKFVKAINQAIQAAA